MSSASRMLGVTISRGTRPGSRSSSWSPRGKFLIISHQTKIAFFFFFLSVKIKIKINYFALLLFFKPCYTDVYIYLSRNNGRNWISVSGIVRLANRLFSRLHPRTHTNFHHGLNCFKYRTRDNNPRRWISFMNIFFYISRWARERKEISEIYRGRKLQGFCFVKLLGDGSLRDNDLQIRRIVYI